MIVFFFNLLAFLIFANQFVHGINKYYMLHFTWGGGGNKLQGYIGCGVVFLHYMLHGGMVGGAMLLLPEIVCFIHC